MRNRRRGYTLVEILVAMTVFTVLMGLAIGLVERLLKLESSGQSHVQATRAVARLARAFRADAHAADRIKTPEPGSGPFDRLTFLGPGERTVEYAITKGDAVRIEREGGTFRRTEQYPIPGGSARIELARAEPRTLAALVLDRRVGTGRREGGRRWLRIEAALGLDGRQAGGDEP